MILVLAITFYYNAEALPSLLAVPKRYIETAISSKWVFFNTCLDSMLLSCTYTFQSESTLCSCLNVKKLFVENRRKIWSLSNCNWTRTHNHLVRKQTLNHLAKLANLVKRLSVRLRTRWLWVRVQLQLLICLDSY